jgi:hypothetical protein
MPRLRRTETLETADMQDVGTIYVLANRDQSLAKIGLTRDGTPDARATDYERAHGIKWHVYWSAVSCYVAEAEAAAHRELDICRFALVPGAREAPRWRSDLCGRRLNTVYTDVRPGPNGETRHCASFKMTGGSRSTPIADKPTV